MRNSTLERVGWGILAFGLAFAIWAWFVDPLHGIGWWLDTFGGRYPADGDAGDGLVVLAGLFQLICWAVGYALLWRRIKVLDFVVHIMIFFWGLVLYVITPLLLVRLFS